MSKRYLITDEQLALLRVSSMNEDLDHIDNILYNIESTQEVGISKSDIRTDIAKIKEIIL